MTSPHVTIGLPVYNGAEFLDEALSTLCAQTYQDLEILISDNGSTDETPQIIEKWAKRDSRIKCYRQPKTMPILDHFLWVINKNDSKWFCYAAHDDMWSPNYIEELIKPLKENSEAVISVPHRVLMDIKGEHGQERSFIPYDKNMSLRKKIKHNFDIVFSAWYYALFDRQALIEFQKSVVYFDKSWGKDFATYLSFLFSDKIVGSDKAVFYQRDTGLSGQRYRPKTARDMYVHYRDIWKEMFHHINQSELSFLEKLCLTRQLYRYANNVVKPRRIVKALIKETFSKA